MIEAKKYAASGNSHMPRLDDARDPRLRIDTGKLIRALTKGRQERVSAIYYGSRPPHNDKVWDDLGHHECVDHAFEAHHSGAQQMGIHDFKEKIFIRSKGNEKEVDTTMTADICSLATEMFVGAKHDKVVEQQKARTRFVIVTGDRDLRPAVQRARKCEIPVDLWAWDGALSSSFNELIASGEWETRFSIHYLEDVFKEISFTYVISTRGKEKLHPCHTIILLGLPEAGDDEGAFNRLITPISTELLQLGHEFYFCEDSESTDAFIEFPNASPNVLDVIMTKARAILQKVQHRFKDPLKLASWPEYHNGGNKASIKPGGADLFKPLNESGQPISVSTDGKSKCGQCGAKPSDFETTYEEPDDGQEWQPVISRHKSQRRKSVIRK